MNNKNLLMTIVGSVMLTVATTAMASLPPRYLEVKDFSKCLTTKNMGTWESWCMPDVKPSLCPETSWEKLNHLTGLDEVPSCQEMLKDTRAR